MRALRLAEQEAEQRSWVSRVNEGIKMRKAGEQMITKALRERLGQVGEAQWLRECEQEFGWAERTAYRHLNPEGMEEHRAQQRQRRAAVQPAHGGQVTSRQESEREPSPPPEAEQQAEETRADAPESEEQVKLALEMVRVGCREMSEGVSVREQADLAKAKIWALRKLR